MYDEQSHKLETMKKPTVKNLNNTLLKFVQGSKIKEKDLTNSKFDGKQVKSISIARNFVWADENISELQVMRLVYKDITGIIKKMLRNKDFEGKIHFDATRDT